MISEHFKLEKEFVNGYKNKTPDFGFGGLGLFTYLRTYSRTKEDGTNEEWWETVERVVNGTYSIQKDHIVKNGLGWDDKKAQESAQEMYDRIFTMKFLPPGRGLWTMGTDIVEKKGGAASLNNCGACSTANIHRNFAKPFMFMMDMSMLGVGVGFDTDGDGKVTIHKPKCDVQIFVVPDSREGWVESLRLLMESYTAADNHVIGFDYSKIRPPGAPIKSFGGVSQGAMPLMQLHEGVARTLDALDGKQITTRAIMDIMNMIGKCVIAGNVRRSAELALGPPTEEFLSLKDYKKNPDRTEYGWASNNSIRATLGMDYSGIVPHVIKNGEPGFTWFQNVQTYGRMGEEVADKATLFNPCQPSWATILTPDGIKTIADIKAGDTIWSGSEWTTVVKKWSTGIKDVYAYRTRAGTFYGTENHRIVSNGTKIEVGQADSIDTSQGPVAPFIGHDAQAIMDGLVIGDGTVHKASGNLVLLCIGKRDTDYFKSEIANFIGEHRPGITPGAYEIKTTITSLPKTYERKVPEEYVTGSVTTKQSFLRGLYSANGSVVRDRVTLKAASFKLIEQVQMMLSSLGIKSYYTVNKAHDVEFGNGNYTCRESYDLNITTDSAKFARMIGFIQAYKTEKLNEISRDTTGKNNYEVVEVEFVSTEEVFDMTVSCEAHTYWTGGLLVSNCVEQPLEPWELCTLVETFPARNDSLEDYKRTLKFAYLYAKTVTLAKTHWTETNRVMFRNRRVGTSMSGIAQAIAKVGLGELRKWAREGYKTVNHYDDVYSDWLAVPKSVRITTIKPSGTVSLLAGATPGMHFPESRFYIRRVRVSKTSKLWQQMKEAGYDVEEDKVDNTAMVVSFPIDVGPGVKTVDEVSIWEQLSLAAFLQENWSDNAVSVTVTFKPEEADQIAPALDYFQYKLKAVSFLPRAPTQSYPQMPYEAIDEATYNVMAARIKGDKIVAQEDGKGDRYCDGDYCVV